jgi:molybdate transport system ATP-binding protein
VAGNVAFGIEGLPRGERDERVRELLRLLRLEDLAERRPAQLSGGQKQRTSLARALATAPRLLLLDEPLSALDAPAREELRGELRRLLVAVGRPALFVTHDRLEALAIGDRLAVVVSGRIAQIGPVEEVFSRPASPEVARLVGVETVVAARIVERPGDGMVLLAVAAGDSGELLLSAIDPGGDEDAVLACVRADEVVLERGPIGQVSARNRLACRIVSLAPEGPLVRVGLDCGFRLTALVTRQSRSEMELEPGAEVTAFVKTPSVHLIPHRRPG